MGNFYLERLQKIRKHEQQIIINTKQKIKLKNMIAQTEFHWFSSLGISVILFLVYGTFYLFIGVLTPIMWDSSLVKPGIIMSPRTDEKLFGAEPGKMLAENKPIANLRKIMLAMLAAMLVVSGLLVIATAWFGLRTGNTWALIVLTIVGIVVLPFWWLVFKPYLDAGIKITLADAPPFIWVPAMLYLPAIIFGWIGVK